MTPIDNLREGIKQGKWSLVCQGFRELTGQTLPEPVEKKLDKPDNNDMLDRLSYISEMLADAIRSINVDDVGFVPQPETTVAKPAKPPKKPKSTSSAKPAPKVDDDIFPEEELDDDPPEPAKPEPDPFAKFRVQNGTFNKEGKVAAVAKPLEKFVNNFVDDKKTALQELKETKSLNKKVKKQGKLKPLGERGEFTEVDQLCTGCGKTFKIHPSLVPQPLESGEPTPEYRCDRCGTRGRK